MCIQWGHEFFVYVKPQLLQRETQPLEGFAADKHRDDNNNTSKDSIANEICCDYNEFVQRYTTRSHTSILHNYPYQKTK